MKPLTRLVLPAILLALAALAGARSKPPKKDAHVEPREAQLIAALPDEDRHWLTEFVAPIILPDEKNAYLELTETYQREDFREKFWQRRERPDLPPLLGPGYRYRYRELRELADARYDGWRSDAGRMVIRFGEPSEIVVPTCAGEEDLRPGIEVWKYASPPEGLRRRHLLFFRLYSSGPRRLWTVGDPDGPALFVPSSCRKRLADLQWDCTSKPWPPGDPCSMCLARCDVFTAYAETSLREGNAMGALAEKAQLLAPPDLSTEDLARRGEKWATTSKPGAKPIAVEGPASSRASGAAAGPALTPSPTPGPPRRLSPEELAQRIAALETRYRDWLDLARPLLTDQEVSTFVQISNAEKDAFIEKFWKREKGPDARHPQTGAPERTPAAPSLSTTKRGG